MNPRSALLGFAAITVCYLGALGWADSRNHVFAGIPQLIASMPVLVGLSLLSYVVRYARWRWLLQRAGHRTGIARGFLAYLAGFAFTATPGKVGELVRIRYLAPLGVPARSVIAAFVYERAFDLVAVLLLASLAIARADLLLLSAAFVGVFVVALLVVTTHPRWLALIAGRLDRAGWVRVAKLCATFNDGLAMCRTWATWADASIALAAGVVAWTIASISFVWLLGRLGIVIPEVAALAIYPLAMLAGAASMLPGGVGSTEAAIVALLLWHGVTIGTGALAAVGIRLSSLWFAVLCGLISAGLLETWQRGEREADR